MKRADTWLIIGLAGLAIVVVLLVLAYESGREVGYRAGQQSDDPSPFYSTLTGRQ